MNNKRDFDRAVDRWLDDGSDATPPDVIDAVLLAARSTPQERDVRILWRTEPMTIFLRAAAVLVTVVVAGATALYAFGSPGPNFGSMATPEPSTQLTLTPQATDSADNPDEPLGVLDLEAFERRFEVELSRAPTLSGSSNIQYDSVDVDSEEPAFALGFTVEADDPNNAIVGTGITSPLPDFNAALVDEWLAFVAETQPDVAAWLMTERDEYLAAPGAEIRRAQWFGGLCAGFLASRPMFAPGSGVNSFYMWVQDAKACP